MKPLGIVLSLTMAVATVASGQDRCRFELLPGAREGLRTEPVPGVVNYFVGGNVRARCIGQSVRISADSVASYQGTVIQFIGHVHYSDSTADMTADFGTYFRDSDRWEARGHVVFMDLESRSTLIGPSLDYFRPLAGSRPVTEMYADQRPTIHALPTDSVATDEEPYVIVGDRVRIRGQDNFWAGGRVTIDRSDLLGRGDSLQLDTGPGNNGLLLGRASIRRMASDSFRLDADRIDLGLETRELRSVYAQAAAHLISQELDLTADSIRLQLTDRVVEHTEAWGDSLRATAVADDYRVQADSLAIDTPRQRLREVRAFGSAWAGLPTDSAGETGDWIAGDAVQMTFRESAPEDSTTGATLERLRAVVEARSYFRVKDQLPGSMSINYTRADTIIVLMKGTGDSVTVDLVRALGRVDGLQLQPAVARATADTTAADSARAVLRRPVPPGLERRP